MVQEQQQQQQQQPERWLPRFVLSARRGAVMARDDHGSSTAIASTTATNNNDSHKKKNKKTSFLTKVTNNSLRILRALLVLSLVASWGNLRLHGHVELEFAGMTSSIEVPKLQESSSSSASSSSASSSAVLLSPMISSSDRLGSDDGDGDDGSMGQQQKGPRSTEALRSSVQNPSSSSSSFLLEQQQQQPKYQSDMKYRPGQLLYYDERALARDRQLYLVQDPKLTPIIKSLLRFANKAIKAGPWSVVDKPSTMMAPSGEKQDFFSLIKDDQNNNNNNNNGDYDDAVRLKEFQYNTTMLCLAYAMTKSEKYATSAVEKLRTWFITHATRMSPHMKYAKMKQRRPAGEGNGPDVGTLIQRTISPGHLDIMEHFQFHVLLDAIRMLEGHWTPVQMAKLRRWLVQYMTWLGALVKTAHNDASPGFKAAPFFDIERMAIMTYLNETTSSKLHTYMDKASSRMQAQILENGRMPLEVKDENCEYRMLRTLQGWSIFSRMAMSVDRNRNFWNIIHHGNGNSQDEDNNSTNNSISTNNNNNSANIGMSVLCRASEYVIPFYGQRSEKCKPGIHDHEVSAQSWWPLVYESQMHCPELRGKAIHIPNWLIESSSSSTNSNSGGGGGGVSDLLPPQSVYDMPSLLYPSQHLMAPFWHLGKEFPQEILSR